MAPGLRFKIDFRPRIANLFSMKQKALALLAPTVLLEEHLDGLKLTPEEVEDALALHTFQNEHYTDGAKIVGGGRIHIAQKILSEIREIKRRLELLDVARDSLSQDPGTREAALQEEAMLRRSCKVAIDQYTKLAKHIEEGALGWAQIEAQHKAIDAEVAKPRSGWQPLQVKTIIEAESETSNGE